MFRKELKDRLVRIFDVTKTTFDRPSESMEQEIMFIEVEKASVVIQDAQQSARVQGKIVLFGQYDKLPFGFLSKKIHEAEPEDTDGFFFHTFEENKGTFANIAERSANFVFLYRGDYDPAQGEINEVNLGYTEE